VKGGARGRDGGVDVGLIADGVGGGDEGVVERVIEGAYSFGGGGDPLRSSNEVLEYKSRKRGTNCSSRTLLFKKTFPSTDLRNARDANAMVLIFSRCFTF
jgi:hypothetical protein